MPDLYDVDGAAFGIVRLHSLYKFNLTRLIEEGVISTTLDNGQVVLSSPSVLKLTCKSFIIITLRWLQCQKLFYFSL